MFNINPRMPLSPNIGSSQLLSSAYPAPPGSMIPVAAVVMNDDPFNEMHGQPVIMGEEVKEPAPKEGLEAGPSSQR